MKQWYQRRVRGMKEIVNSVLVYSVVIRMTDVITNYEKERLEKIQQNQEFLSQLNLERLSSLKSPPKPRTKKPVKDVRIMRQSPRIQLKHPVDYNEKRRREVSSKQQKRRKNNKTVETNEVLDTSEDSSPKSQNRSMVKLFSNFSAENLKIDGKCYTNENEIRKSRVRVLFTDISNSLEYAKWVIRLGGSVVDEVIDCTHLLTRCLTKRTVNLLGAMRFSKFILHLDWLIKSIQEMKFLDESNYWVEDREAEKIWGFSLRESKMLSTTYPFGLFHKCYFVLTRSCDSPGMRKIVCDSGGQILERNSIPNIEIPRHIFVLTHPLERENWATSQHFRNITFLDKEFLFTSILRQKISVEQNFLLSCCQ
eukprot:TRINITY_DN8336_c0_g1_i8.p1 TRINITY_DN8336_c0_g1~~TRINITY_DN8336_c0_g1_i8.p1  ORF type:complete len:366 (+),score=67.88 TRINITY_DN8336_c0_g1_i8:1660-2757(+)